MSALPRAARWLLRLAAEGDRGEDLVGDLEELHRERVERLGSLAGYLASLADALFMAGVLFAERVTVSAWMSSLDLKLALRLVRKRPMLNVTAVLALTVGLGLANVGITFVDALVFSRLPYEGGDRFVVLRAQLPDGRSHRPSPQRIHLIEQNAASLEFLGGHRDQRLYLTHPSGDVETVVAASLSPEAFRFLPARPVLGRLLTQEDAAPGAAPVAVLRESLWRSLEGGTGDGGLFGTIQLAGVRRAVVGVLPDDFRFPDSPDVWIPLEDRYLGGTHLAVGSGVEIFGRLREGASWPELGNEVELSSRRYELEISGTEQVEILARPFAAMIHPGEWAMLGTMMAGLLFVLLVLAANVGSLFLVRAASRGAEMAMRSALGAPRRRLIVQVLLEVAVLVGFAAVLAFWISGVGLEWFRHRHLTEAPYWLELTPSPRTALAAAIVALVATAVAGLAPALRATRLETSSQLKAGSGAGRLSLGRLTPVLTVLQMALAISLVSAALVTGRGALGHWNPSLGLPRGEILTAQSWMKPVKAERAEERRRLMLDKRQHMLEAIADIPGVRQVSGTSSLPGDVLETRWVEIEAAGGRSSITATAPVADVLPGFFETLRLEPTAGRFLGAEDLVPGAPPVAVVNELFAEKYFGGQALGRRVRTLGGDDRADPWREIVGVAPNLGMSLADPERAGGFYVPMGPGRGVELAIRVEGEPMAFSGHLRKAVAEVDPEIRLIRVQPLEDVGTETFHSMAMFSGSLSTLGGASLLLSLVGFFVVTSLAVTQRTREIGVRVALGATPREIISLVSRRALVQLAVGAGLGAVLATLLLLGLGRLDDHLPVARPWELPAVAVGLGLVGLLAFWWPARRALCISPSQALAED